MESNGGWERIYDGGGLNIIGQIKTTGPNTLEVYDSSCLTRFGYCNEFGTFNNWGQRISTNIAPYLLFNIVQQH